MTTSKGERTTKPKTRGLRRSRIESPLCRLQHQLCFTIDNSVSSRDLAGAIHDNVERRAYYQTKNKRPATKSNRESIVPTTTSTVLHYLHDTNNSIPRRVRAVKEHHTQ
jgi:hypothetical protein